MKPPGAQGVVAGVIDAEPGEAIMPAVSTLWQRIFDPEAVARQTGLVMFIVGSPMGCLSGKTARGAGRGCRHNRRRFGERR